jgi:hypothetical protein
MATTPTTPTTSNPIQAALHGPYEDAIIAGFSLLEKLIDGQTADQKAKIWSDWIAFWQPFVDLGKAFGANLAKQIQGL